MNILYLTNNSSTLELYEWLRHQGENVYLKESKFTFIDLDNTVVDFIISYGYKYIIKNEIINKFNNRIINLHISYLPWNKGANPNIWSFLENTPKGVTIHLIDEDIDTGDILYQQELFFDEENETLKSSYEKLQQEMERLFKENWVQIRSLDFKPKKQKGSGSLHKVKDFEKISSILHGEGWDITIKKLKENYSKLVSLS